MSSTSSWAGGVNMSVRTSTMAASSTTRPTSPKRIRFIKVPPHVFLAPRGTCDPINQGLAGTTIALAQKAFPQMSVLL